MPTVSDPRFPHRAFATRAGALAAALGACTLGACTLVACGLAACGGRRDAPPAATAASVAAAPALPPARLSRFAVPLDYDVTPILGTVERVVPRTFGSLDSAHQAGTDPRKHFAFTATRAPFVASIAGGEVHMRTTLAYAARGYYRTPIGATLQAGCGGATVAARPRVVVELVAPITLAPDWHLRAATRLARLEPASAAPADRCRIGIISMDVTDRVVDAARQALTGRMRDIDRKVAAVDLTGQATGWWHALIHPIRLTDSVYLMLGPQRLRVGNVGGTGHVLAVAAGLDAYPRIVTGPEPTVDSAPLPPLARGVQGDGFDVLLEGVIGYPTASRTLTAALRGRTVSQAGQSVTVQGVSASAADSGRLALAVAFTGDASGTLRLVGRPRLDSAGTQLAVPDLDYDLATNSPLINALAAVRLGLLRDLLRARARVPLAPALERGRSLLLSGLNRRIGDALTLSATVDSVAVRGLYITAPGIVVRAAATGRARASVRQPRGQ